MEHVKRLMEKPDCSYCEDVHSGQGTPPPCQTCLPSLFPENEEAAQVFFLVRNQVRFSPAGKLLDIDLQAVEIAMRRLGVKRKNECFLKTVALWRQFAAEASTE